MEKGYYARLPKIILSTGSILNTMKVVPETKSTLVTTIGVKMRMI
tara:strand:- start:318 stop:452 length:135 start_codon:yes stop_codon:yes gene_type:complete